MGREKQTCMMFIIWCLFVGRCSKHNGNGKKSEKLFFNLQTKWFNDGLPPSTTCNDTTDAPALEKFPRRRRRARTSHKIVKKTHNESYFKTLQVVNIKRHGLINILSGQQGFIASSRPSALLVGFFTRSHCVAAPHRRELFPATRNNFSCCISCARRVLQDRQHLPWLTACQFRSAKIESVLPHHRNSLSRRRCRGETHTGKFHTLFFRLLLWRPSSYWLIVDSLSDSAGDWRCSSCRHSACLLFELHTVGTKVGWRGREDKMGLPTALFSLGEKEKKQQHRKANDDDERRRHCCTINK